MRQGNEFSQHVDRTPEGDAMLRLPLELAEEWKDMKFVVWRDNRDGTYTLIPREG